MGTNEIMAPTNIAATCASVLNVKACEPPPYFSADGNANGIPVATPHSPPSSLGQLVSLHHPERDETMKEPPASIEQLIDKFDLDYEIAADLMSLRGTEIVVIADDSASMRSASTMRGVPEVKTRWQELQYTLTKLLDILLFVDCDGGFELQFLNSNAAPTAIHSAGDLNDVWRWASPRGGTPLVGRTRQFTNTKPGADRILMVMTDGLPSDGSFDTLRQTVRAKRSNVYMNFMMCTSDDEVVVGMKIPSTPSQELMCMTTSKVRRSRSKRVATASAITRTSPSASSALSSRNTTTWTRKNSTDPHALAALCKKKRIKAK